MDTKAEAESTPQQTLTEAVGVFHNAESLRSAADSLLISGFDREALSLLASQAAVEKKLGHPVHDVHELEDDPRVLTQAYSGGDSLTEAKTAAIGGLFFVGAVAAAGAIVASGGGLAAAIVGVVAGGGTGGFIGGIVASMLGLARGEAIQEQIEKGGLLLWVRTADAAQEERAQQILRDHGAEDVHLHRLPEVEFGGDQQVYGYLNWLEGLPRPQT